jgi:hypothetical protein
MTKYALMRLIALSLAASFARIPAAAQATSAFRLAVRDDSKLWIEGSSNLRSWSCETRALDADISVDPSWERAVIAEGVNLSTLVRRVDIRVPVQSLKCGNRRMERIMYDALKVSEVGYILGSFDAVPGAAEDTLVVHTKGTLTVAGRENAVRMDVRAERLPGGVIRATSAVSILMTDYGVKPPIALLGMLQTDNKIVVKFELFVAPQAVIAAAAGGSER